MPEEKKRNIIFLARKKVIEPVKVEFKTQDGKIVKFIAKKEVTKPVKVEFKAKK